MQQSSRLRHIRKQFHRSWFALGFATILLVVGLTWRAASWRRPRKYDKTITSAQALKNRLEDSAPPSVLLVSIDALRADHVGIYGYSRPTTPHIDSWFRNSQIFEQAFSTEASTTPSIVSVLTGLLPQDHGVRLFFQHVPSDVLTVSDLLRETGYVSAAVVSNMVLTAEAAGLDERFDHYDDFVNQRETYRHDVYERRASDTTDAALHWLLQAREEDKPFFLWVHYNDPHGPYTPPLTSSVDFTHSDPVPISPDQIPDYQRHPDVNDGLEYVDRYDEEIAYADEQVGRLLNAFEELNLESYLAILTADHGETLMEHEEWFSHGYQVYEEIIRVPLMLRDSRGTSQRVTHAVSTADVAPTILKRAGIVPPEDIYGQSLWEPKADRAILSESTDWEHQWRSIRCRTKKWVVELRKPDELGLDLAAALFGWRDLLTPTPRKYRYYDLVADPAEQHAIVPPNGSVPVALIKAIRADPDPAGIASPIRRSLNKGHGPEAPKVMPGVPKQALDRLRALGYVQ